MPGNLTDRYRHTANSRDYWQPGKPVGVFVRDIRQITYLFQLNAVLDLNNTQ